MFHNGAVFTQTNTFLSTYMAVEVHRPSCFGSMEYHSNFGRGMPPQGYGYNPSGAYHQQGYMGPPINDYARQHLPLHLQNGYRGQPGVPLHSRQAYGSYASGPYAPQGRPQHQYKAHHGHKRHRGQDGAPRLQELRSDNAKKARAHYQGRICKGLQRRLRVSSRKGWEPNVEQFGPSARFRAPFPYAEIPDTPGVPRSVPRAPNNNDGILLAPGELGAQVFWGNRQNGRCRNAPHVSALGILCFAEPYIASVLEAVLGAD